MKFEKLIATILTAIMTASTFSGAVLAAYDLGDYPDFLMDNHNLDAYVVIGTGGSDPAGLASDVAGAVDVAVRLAGESYELTACGASTTVVTGGKSEDVPIGKAVSASGYLDTTFTDDDLAGLQDTSISFQNDNYNIHDEIRLSNTQLNITSSLSGPEDDYGTGVYLEVGTNALMYYYVFDQTINVSAASSSQPLEIKFLGKTMKITSVSTATKFTAYVGDTYSMTVGDSVTVEGKTVTLVDVGSGGSVRLDIDGTTYTISGTQTKAGIEVTVDDYFYRDNREECAATLIMGKQATETYQNDNKYKEDDNRCDHDPADTDCWQWHIAGLTSNAATDIDAGSGPILGIRSAFIIKSNSYNPITAGECYPFPNGYAEVCMDSLTVDDDTGYMQLTIELRDGVNLNSTITDQTTIYIHAGATDGLQLESDSLSKLTADKRTDQIWLVNSSELAETGVSVWYMDTDGTKSFAGTINNTDRLAPNKTARVYWGDTKDDNIEFYLTGDIGVANDINLTLDILGKTSTDLANKTDDINIQLKHGSNGFAGLGASANTEESDELQWGENDGNQFTWTNIGTKDEDHRTMYGIIVKDPKSHGASDEVVLSIPNEQVMAKITVKGPDTTITSSDGSSVKKVVPITNAVAKLDSEISDPATVGKNLVLVGGSAVNKWSAQALGLDYPTYGGSGLLPFASGEGYVKVFEDVFTTGQTVVLVAGWEASDTRNAASVMQQFGSFADQLDENVAVKVTDVSASGITAAD